MKYFTFFFSTILILNILVSCNKPGLNDDILIGLAGTADQLNGLDKALERMAEPFCVLDSISMESLDDIDLLILPKDAFANDAGCIRSRNSLLIEWVHSGGCLLIFSINEKEFSTDLLPYEIRFAVEDPSIYGNYDFSEQIADTTHPIFNRPHRLRYLAGLEESSRLLYTAPEWEVLLAKNGDHPSSDHMLDNPTNDVGSIFESSYGNGHILVCQPIIERYHAENAAIAPHPLEGGVKLFENVIEYMKQFSSGKDLPIATLKAIPSFGPPGKEISFKISLESRKVPASCLWDFGDGSKGKGININHTYSHPNTYWIKAIVTNEQGDTDHAACRVVIAEKKELRWSDQLVDALMHRYYPNPGRIGPNYRTALVMTGLLDVYERTGKEEILEYVRGFFQGRLIDRWDKRPFKGETETGGDFVDLYSLMAPAWRVFNITGDSVYLQMVREVWTQSLAVDHSLPRDLFWSPYIWGGRRAIVDFTYFKSQLRGMAWEDSKDRKLLDETATQLVRFAQYFQDTSDSLYFMAIDLDHKAYFTSPDRPSGLNDSKWSRAEGWTAMALTELMIRLDRNHPLWPELEDIVTRFFIGLMHAQDPETGLWALVVDQRNYPGMWLETTGSSMIVSSICRLIEAGVLQAEPYLDCARKGYNGLQQRIGLGHWDYPYLSDACQGTAPRLNLDRWIQAHRHDNDFHVIGPFLSAEEALWRVAPPDIAVIGNLKDPENLAGHLLNVGGYSFFSIPELYNSPNLEQFRALIIERNAADNNTANIAAYPEKLSEYAEKGGTILIMEQENIDWLIQIFPDLGNHLENSPNETIVEAIHGAGRIIYCLDYPQFERYMSENERVAALKIFAETILKVISYDLQG